MQCVRVQTRGPIDTIRYDTVSEMASQTHRRGPIPNVTAASCSASSPFSSTDSSSAPGPAVSVPSAANATGTPMRPMRREGSAAAEDGRNADDGRGHRRWSPLLVAAACLTVDAGQRKQQLLLLLGVVGWRWGWWDDGGVMAAAAPWDDAFARRSRDESAASAATASGHGSLLRRFRVVVVGGSCVGICGLFRCVVQERQ